MANKITKVYKNWVEYDIYASWWAAGAGDVSWPASATNGHLAVFDWTTWKLIKDWWAVPTGTITGITMNWASKWTSWVVDLWTVITEHQDISWKQDKLVSWTNIKTINSTSLLGSGNIAVLTSANISDTAFGSSWNGDTTHAPSKNAIYDVLWDVETLLAAL